MTHLRRKGEVTDVIEADERSLRRTAHQPSGPGSDGPGRKTSIVEQRRQDQYDSLLEEWRDMTRRSRSTRKSWDKVDFEDTGSDDHHIRDRRDYQTDDGSADDTSAAIRQTTPADQTAALQDDDCIQGTVHPNKQARSGKCPEKYRTVQKPAVKQDRWLLGLTAPMR